MSIPVSLEHLWRDTFSNDEEMLVAPAVQMLPSTVPMTIVELEGDQLSCCTEQLISISSNNSILGIPKHWSLPF